MVFAGFAARFALFWTYNRYSYAADVWSLGVTIYEAAMLVPPFRGSNICQACIFTAQYHS